MYFSIAAHLFIFLFVTFGVVLLPSPPAIKIGLGEGGGQGGDFITVGLSEDLSGGEGMVKPAVEPRAEVAPIPEDKNTEEVKPDVPDEKVFVEQEKKKTKPKPVPKPPAKSKETEAKPSKPGLIPREPEPGAGGPTGGSAGSGGGFGSGTGVKIGSGTGQEGMIDSWYIRQVQRKISQNWLRTSLGNLKRVRAVASFIVSRNGRIGDIELNESSGIRSVDLAVQRAIQASDPLPPLPYELRDRVVKFEAVFEYPPN